MAGFILVKDFWWQKIPIDSKVLNFFVAMQDRITEEACRNSHLNAPNDFLFRAHFS